MSPTTNTRKTPKTATLQGERNSSARNARQQTSVPDFSMRKLSSPKQTSARPASSPRADQNAQDTFPPAFCPYHTPILQLKVDKRDDLALLDPMERFLMAGPAEEPAVFARPDNGEVSIAKGCTCAPSPEDALYRDIAELDTRN